MYSGKGDPSRPTPALLRYAMAAGGLFFCVMSANRLWGLYAVSTGSAMTEARITGKEPGVRGGDRIVYYSFRDRSGVLHRGLYHTTREDYSIVHPDDPVAILYATRFPDVNGPPNNFERPRIWAIACALLFIYGALWLVMWLSMRGTMEYASKYFVGPRDTHPLAWDYPFRETPEHLQIPGLWFVLFWPFLVLFGWGALSFAGGAGGPGKILWAAIAASELIGCVISLLVMTYAAAKGFPRPTQTSTYRSGEDGPDYTFHAKFAVEALVCFLGGMRLALLLSFELDWRRTGLIVFLIVWIATAILVMLAMGGGDRKKKGPPYGEPSRF